MPIPITYGFGHWLRFFGETETAWAATRPARIERFIDDLRGRGLKPSSINTVLTVGHSAKRRPVVRMPPSPVAYLRQLPRESDHVVSFRGRAVHRYYTALGERVSTSG